MVFTTDRLTVTDWQPDLDTPALERAVTAMLVPEVLPMLSPPARDLSAGARGWIDRQAEQADGAVIRLGASGQIAGQIAGLILLAKPGDGATHLGYLFVPQLWGQGLATEMLHGLLGYLRTHAPCRLVAGVAETNPASIRVLEKAGFVRIPSTDPDTRSYSLDLRPAT